MSENELPEVPATALGPIRPLSVRITDGLRAQLEVIAQLSRPTTCTQLSAAPSGHTQAILASTSDAREEPCRAADA